MSNWLFECDDCRDHIWCAIRPATTTERRSVVDIRCRLRDREADTPRRSRLERLRATRELLVAPLISLRECAQNERHARPPDGASFCVLTRASSPHVPLFRANGALQQRSHSIDHQKFSINIYQFSHKDSRYLTIVAIIDNYEIKTSNSKNMLFIQVIGFACSCYRCKVILISRYGS